MLKTFAKLGKIASENLYFHKKDRELIKKIKENNRLKQKGRGSTVCWPLHMLRREYDLQEWEGVTVALCNSVSTFQ